MEIRVIMMCTLSLEALPHLIPINQPYQNKKKRNSTSSTIAKAWEDNKLHIWKGSLPLSPAGLQSQANGQSCPLRRPLSSCSSCTGHRLPLWAGPLLSNAPSHAPCRPNNRAHHGYHRPPQRHTDPIYLDSWIYSGDCDHIGPSIISNSHRS